MSQCFTIILFVCGGQVAGWSKYAHMFTDQPTDTHKYTGYLCNKYCSSKQQQQIHIDRNTNQSHKHTHKHVGAPTNMHTQTLSNIPTHTGPHTYQPPHIPAANLISNLCGIFSCGSVVHTFVCVCVCACVCLCVCVCLSLSLHLSVCLSVHQER